MGLFTLQLAALLLLLPALISAYRVTGSVGETLRLPCNYPTMKSSGAMCWGRGTCSTTGCNNLITTVSGNDVSWKRSDKYVFPGNLAFGDVSLSLSDVTLDDAGTYCCFIKIPGLGLELKKEISVEIQHPMTKDNIVRGSVDDTLTLPCKYPVTDGVRTVCWGKGSCGLTGCGHPILNTDGKAVTWSESGRYHLLGNITNGDVSLTITGVSKDEENTYCCRVRIPGAFNDIKTDIKLEIQDVYLVRGSLGDTLTLPCSYAADNDPHPVCWGKGSCGILLCLNEILTTDDSTVSWRESDRYQLLGNIQRGNVSLTIPAVRADDGGVYCCRVKVPGLFNDLKKEIRLQIRDVDRVTGLVGDTLKLPCKYNASEGTTKMCWGRGSCPTFKCENSIVWTDGEEVTWTESERYQLKGKVLDGDVSLTIRTVKKDDEGTYCCRIEVPGLFNDKMKEINVEVKDDGFQTEQQSQKRFE